MTNTTPAPRPATTPLACPTCGGAIVADTVGPYFSIDGCEVYRWYYSCDAGCTRGPNRETRDAALYAVRVDLGVQS